MTGHSDDGELGRLRLERDLLRRLLELGQRDDIRPFLEDALSLVVEVTRARKGYLQLRLRAGKVGPIAMARGFSESEVDRVREEISTGIVAEAIATGSTVATDSAMDDPRFRSRRSVQGSRIRAVLCVPVGSPPIGVLYLQGRPEPGPFGHDDREYAEIFARHLAPLADRLLAREDERALTDHTLELRARLCVDRIAGRSQALAEVFRQILVAAPVPVGVLVTGETGTGKTLVARALHDSSPRRSGPFVEVNCGAIPDTLFESELFGAERGAHSTATRRIDGKIDAAAGGTLFLDDVSEIPLAVQPKLLMFLQSRRYYRLGSVTPLDADVRVVAATNRSLEELVKEKRLREDLYFRLNVLQVEIPPLRSRLEDVGPIADQLLASFEPPGEPAMLLSRSARTALLEHDWPGNVRELENVLRRGWASARSEKAPAIGANHLFPAAKQAGGEEGALTYQDAMRSFQARLLKGALDENGWNVTETARKLDMARSHLNDLIRIHGLRERR